MAKKYRKAKKGNKKKTSEKKTPHYCPECGEKFTRKFNVTLHLRTQHAEYVEKAICPLKNRKCNPFYSTKENLQVHLLKHHRGKKIVKNKVDGKPIEWVVVPRSEFFF